jgi:hypothetical protein
VDDRCLDVRRRAGFMVGVAVHDPKTVIGEPTRINLDLLLARPRWPAGSGDMRRPLAPLPARPNPTDPGDAADLSTP